MKNNFYIFREYLLKTVVKYEGFEIYILIKFLLIKYLKKIFSKKGISLNISVKLAINFDFVSPLWHVYKAVLSLKVLNNCFKFFTLVFDYSFTHC